MPWRFVERSDSTRPCSSASADGTAALFQWNQSCFYVYYIFGVRGRGRPGAPAPNSVFRGVEGVFRRA